MAPVLSADIDELVASADSVDIESVIAAFVADPSQNALELPHMTTGQRKHARKIADQHLDIKCESFGLGASRQLHLFKRSSPKNRLTSSAGIASGIVAEVEAAGVALDVEAMIRGLLEDPKETKLEFPHMSTAQRKKAARLVDQHPELTCECYGLGLERQLHVFKQQQVASPSNSIGHSPTVGSSSECSTTASSRSSSGSPSSKDQDLLGLPEGCQVRNTFIHMSGSSALDERVVRSMPHGMFGQCLKDELAEIQKGTATRAEQENLQFSSALGVVSSDLRFLPGARVVIDGLSKSPAFNGLAGVVQSWDADTERYNIQLFSPSSGHYLAKVKCENLQSSESVPEAFENVAPGFSAHLEFVESQFLASTEMPPSPTWEDTCVQCFAR